MTFHQLSNNGRVRGKGNSRPMPLGLIEAYKALEAENRKRLRILQGLPAEEEPAKLEKTVEPAPLTSTRQGRDYHEIVDIDYPELGKVVNISLEYLNHPPAIRARTILKGKKVVYLLYRAIPDLGFMIRRAEYLGDRSNPIFVKNFDNLFNLPGVMGDFQAEHELKAIRKVFENKRQEIEKHLGYSLKV